VYAMSSWSWLSNLRTRAFLFSWIFLLLLVAGARPSCWQCHPGMISTRMHGTQTSLYRFDFFLYLLLQENERGHLLSIRSCFICDNLH
jgi:hypothetical protein